MTFCTKIFFSFLKGTDVVRSIWIYKSTSIHCLCITDAFWYCPYTEYLFLKSVSINFKHLKTLQIQLFSPLFKFLMKQIYPITQRSQISAILSRKVHGDMWTVSCFFFLFIQSWDFSAILNWGRTVQGKIAPHKVILWFSTIIEVKTASWSACR